MVAKHLHSTFSLQHSLHIQSIACSEYATGSCPNLMMSRNEDREPRPVPMALAPKLPPRAHRPLCLSISSDRNGRFKALGTQEWKNNLKAKAHSAGAASSTGSLERASLFCASGSTTASSSGLSSPLENLTKIKFTSRFSLLFPPGNSSSEFDSNPPSRSKMLHNYSIRATTGPPGVRVVSVGRVGPPDTPDMHKQNVPEQFQYSVPVISKVTDYIFVGNLNTAFNGRMLCRNNIDSIIDMSSLPGDPGPSLCLIPCTCSQAARHSWSRLKVDICEVPDTLGEGSSALKQRCFEDINKCIEASTEKRKRVLVHCRDGLSLAPTCIIQYLMVKQNMRLIAAFELLRAKYPVNIRECHQNVLVTLERALRPGGNVDKECFKQAISRKVAWT